MKRLDRGFVLTLALISLAGPRVSTAVQTGQTRPGPTEPAAAAPVKPDTSRALVIAFADGKSITRVLRPTGSMWTPGFRKIEGSSSSVPIKALDVAHVVDGADVVVTVSLSTTRPGTRDITVGTYRVEPGKEVRVEGLRNYGVEPITLSVVPIPDTVAFVPEAMSPSVQLDVRAEPVGPNRSSYRIVVRNHAPVGVMWMQIKAYRGDRPAVIARPRGKQNHPLIPPRGEYVHQLDAGTSTPPSASAAGDWQHIDGIDITSLLWQDGVVEGDVEVAKQSAAWDRIRAASIQRVLNILRGAQERPVAGLRPQLANMMRSDPETQQVRDSLMADLESLEKTQRTAHGDTYDTWLAAVTAALEQWLARIVIPKL
jgi:hypothetical protein